MLEARSFQVERHVGQGSCCGGEPVEVSSWLRMWTERVVHELVSTQESTVYKSLGDRRRGVLLFLGFVDEAQGIQRP